MDLIDKSKRKWQDKILKVSTQLCTSLTIPEAEKKISFITSNKWENLKNDVFYRKQIVYNTKRDSVFSAILIEWPGPVLRSKFWPDNYNNKRKSMLSQDTKAGLPSVLRAMYDKEFQCIKWKKFWDF